MKEKAFGQRPYTFDRVVRMTLGAICICLIIWMLFVLRNVLLPFGVAALVAYMLEPMVQLVRKTLHLKGRVAAVFITLFCITLGLSLIIWILAPLVSGEIQRMSVFFNDYTSQEHHVPFIPEDVHRFIKENVNFGSLAATLYQLDWVDILSRTIDLVSGGIDLIITAFNWLMTFLYIVFIMIDYDRLGRGVSAIIPPHWRKPGMAIGRDIKESMNHYFRGQALIAFIVGILFSIGFAIMGLPLAIILGLFIGVLNLVPYLQLISIPITAALCLVYGAQSSVDFWVVFGEAMLVYIIVQAIQDLYLTPRIMGKAMGLNPAIILLSLSVWGTLLGLLGMIIALPTTTLMLSYYERYVIRRRKDRERVESATETPL